MFLLASQSPRRKQILRYFSLPFIQKKPLFDESSIAFQQDPVSYVRQLAMGKANSLAEKHPDHIIIAADTVVIFNNTLYEKPRNKAEAIAFLEALNGNTHEVYTGIVLQKAQNMAFGYERTLITFNTLTNEEIASYADKLHLFDKAGAYSIQEAGSLIVNHINGCFYNVMGLPVNTLEKLLKHFSLSLFNFL